MNDKTRYVLVAGLLGVNSLLYAQSDPDCYKITGLVNTDHYGTRAGCDSENGCNWRECVRGSNEQGNPGNYADNCDPPTCAGS